MAERSRIPSPDSNLNYKGKDAQILRLLQILFSAKNDQTQHEEALECLKSTPDLLLHLLKTVSSPDRSPSTHSSEQDRTRTCNSDSSDEVVAGHSKTDESNTNKISPEDITKQPSVSKEMNEDKKESNKHKKPCKRRRDNTKGGKISNDSKHAKRKASDTNTEVVNGANYQPNTPSSHIRDGETSETLTDDVILARRMLDILMYPPSIHHQRSVLAVLKSDEKLRTVFNIERAKIGNAKIPVFKRSQSNASTAGSDRSSDDTSLGNQYHPVDNNTSLSFLMQHCTAQTQKIEHAATSSQESMLSYSGHLNISNRQFPHLTVTSNLEALNGNTPSCFPSTEHFVQQNLVGQEVSTVTTPEGQQQIEPLLYFAPQEPNDAQLSYPLQLQNNVPTLEGVLQDNFQPMSNEINMIHNGVCHSERTECTPLAENEHSCQSLVNSITSPKILNDTDDSRTDEMMESFFALLEPGHQAQGNNTC